MKHTKAGVVLLLLLLLLFYIVCRLSCLLVQFNFSLSTMLYRVLCSILYFFFVLFCFLLCWITFRFVSLFYYLSSSSFDFFLILFTLRLSTSSSYVLFSRFIFSLSLNSIFLINNLAVFPFRLLVKFICWVFRDENCWLHHKLLFSTLEKRKRRHTNEIQNAR